MDNNLFNENENKFISEESPIDVFDAVVDYEPRKKKVRRFKKRKQTRILVVSLAIVFTLICGAVFFIIAESQEAAKIAAEAAAAEQAEREKAELVLKQSQEYDEIVNSKFFLDGISVEGIALGGKTMAEAKELLNKLLAERTPSGELSLMLNGEAYPFSLDAVQTTSNIDDILAEAFQIARSGSVQDVLTLAAEIKQNGKAYTLTLQHDFTNLAQQVANFALAVDVPVKNASFGEIDKNAHTVTTVEAADGLAVDQTLLVDEIISAVMSNDFSSSIDVPTTTVPATMDMAHLNLISVSATTSFKGSSSNRKYNIQKGADLINGIVLVPGEEFSTNAVLGTRTSKNGWKMANAYVGGTTEEQAGGGVCQLSSTLYNAVVKADLEIVSRRNHSMPVNYVKKGLDATINSVGNIIDFKFKNNTETDVVIFAWTSGNDLNFKIYRCQFATDEYDEIRLTSEKIGTIYPTGEMEEELDLTLLPGTEEIIVERQNGERWQSYKNYYKNGTLVRSEKLALSSYNAYNGKKLIGPPLETLSPSPTVSPSPDISTDPVVTPVLETTPELIITPEPQITAAPTAEPVILTAPPIVPTDEANIVPPGE